MSLMPLTEDVSRAVLSFANTEGGDVFAHWLRNQLMLKLNYFHPNNIYLDNVASRSDGAIRHMGGVDPFKLSEKSSGVSVVGPNTHLRSTTFGPTGDFHSLDGGYITIGAVHSAWFETWQKALKQAKVLLQVQTPDYFTRRACIKEVDEIKKLHQEGSKFHILALGVAVEPIAIINSVTTKIQLRKSGMVSQHLAGSWKISDSQVLEIVKQMGKLGC